MSAPMNHMEVLLLEDVPGVGQRNDIIVVKDGYALNHLLPRRRALVATPTVRKRYAEQIKNRAEEKMKESELARSAAAILKDKTLTFTKKATKAGKLYAGVSEKEISEALHEQLQIEVPEAHVTIAEHIKSTGVHEATVKIGLQDLKVKIEVKAEEEVK